MPEPTPRRAPVPVAQRREAYTRAAVELGSREGVAAVTTHRVAAEAGVGQGLLTYAFPRKADLLAAVVAEVGARVREAAAADDGAQAAQRFAAYLEHASATPGLQLLQYEVTTAALRDDALAGLAREQYEAYAVVVADALVETAGVSREQAAVPARVLLAAVDGLILQGLVDPDAARPAVAAFVAVADRLVADLLAGRGR